MYFNLAVHLFNKVDVYVLFVMYYTLEEDGSNTE